MNKGISLFLSVLITLSFFIIFSFQDNLEEVVVLRAVDGDTVELEDGRVIRLTNINTPEKTEYWYSEALNFTKSLENKKVKLDIKGTERYGRLLGDIYYEGYFNLKIIEEGHGSTLLVEESRVSDFYKAQKEAYNRGNRIWKRSEYFGCIETAIDKDGETVIIYNLCKEDIPLILKDETTNTYDFIISEASIITLHSEKGVNNKTDKYWGRRNAWNDDRDSVFIKDKQGLLVYYDSYGY